MRGAQWPRPRIPSRNLITTQHRQIDSMVAEIVGSMSETEDLSLVRKSFGRMREALDAHKVFQSRLAAVSS
jgi:hypothetical protein